MNDLGIGEDFEFQDVKNQRIDSETLDHLKDLAGSYEKLFSRVARKYKELGLKDKELSEEDYKNYILEEYTFLKRPVFVIENDIFIGSSKKVVRELKERLGIHVDLI